MEKKKIIVLIIMIILIAISGFYVYNNTHKNKIDEDSIKFKKEYESLNGKSAKYKDQSFAYLDVEILEDNKIKYLKTNDIVKHLTTGTQIIYFGSATCNWCRAAIPVLIDVAKENNFENIYYYDFFELREKYENDASEEATKTYEAVIKILDKYIDKTFPEDSSKQGKKRLSAPFVVFVKNGSVVGTHYKTVESHTEYTKNLSTKQKEELKKIYQELTDKMLASVCTIDHEC